MPARPYLPQFYPVQRQSRLMRLFIAFERCLKGRLFGCRMCGSCILPNTAFICPLNCPRGLRNGPCRGATFKRCFINPTARCIWIDIFKKAEQQGHLERLLQVNAPLDHRRLGGETLLRTYRCWRTRNRGPSLRDFIRNRAQFKADVETFCAEFRQPDWWQGDSHYHPPAYSEPLSRLEEKLHGGHFVVSVEVAPPMEVAGHHVTQITDSLKGYIDTANFTDNPLGVPRMSGLACAMQSLDNNLEPVLQLQTRHRSRYDVEAEAIGAAVVGVRNILCMSDDIGRLGPGPTPKPELNDLDAVQALWMLRRLRDEGINVDGQTVERRPLYFLGAIASPYAALPRYEAIVTEKKINAGAQFLQTLPVFDVPRFSRWLEAVDERNLLGKAYLMPAVALLKSARHARFLANDVPGIYIPRAIMTRMENAADAQEEGIQIALDLISQFKGMAGIHGLHLLAPYQEDKVSRLVVESGLKDFVVKTPVNCFPVNGKNKSPLKHSVSPWSSPSAMPPASNPNDLFGTEDHQNLRI